MELQLNIVIFRYGLALACLIRSHLVLNITVDTNAISSCGQGLHANTCALVGLTKENSKIYTVFERRYWLTNKLKFFIIAFLLVRTRTLLKMCRHGILGRKTKYSCYVRFVDERDTKRSVAEVWLTKLSSVCMWVWNWRRSLTPASLLSNGFSPRVIYEIEILAQIRYQRRILELDLGKYFGFFIGYLIRANIPVSFTPL